MSSIKDKAPSGHELARDAGHESTHESTGARDIGRRHFMGAAIGVAAGAGVAAVLPASAQNAPPTVPGQARPTPSPQAAPPAGSGLENAGMRPGGPRLYRVEADIRDVEVEGKIPADLNGAFYRTGPDPQYPLYPGNIPFDGEGHVSMWRIKDGRVHYKSRFVRNDRYVAQEKAGRILFPMYRNPTRDDPSVKGLSRSTANTHIINHKNLLLALKEDSPPSALDLLTLETVEPNYLFDGQLKSATFTAHPKVDSETGNMIAFGYEARGFGTDDVNIFEITPQGKMTWEAWIKVPYVGMIHDFAVTQKHIVFYIAPLAFDEKQIQAGGIHWSWDSSKPTYFGVMRRGGDGKDIRWFKGPERCSTHVMGAWSDGDKVYYDCEMSAYNPFPFMPMRDGQRWDPVKGSSRITRLSVDLSKKSVKDYKMEVLYPNHLGALPRQDDRYNTMPYRYGFLPCPDPDPSDPSKRPAACWARFDNQTRKATVYKASEGTQLAEAVFAPKSRNSPEGVGYLMGVATRNNEGGRADLIILDAERPEDGPIATVKLPIRAAPQIHGWWVPEWQMPQQT
jgi:carotenoid cleavage dioxygenase-like enzyme